MASTYFRHCQTCHCIDELSAYCRTLRISDLVFLWWICGVEQRFLFVLLLWIRGYVMVTIEPGAWSNCLKMHITYVVWSCLYLWASWTAVCWIISRDSKQYIHISLCICTLCHKLLGCNNRANPELQAFKSTVRERKSINIVQMSVWNLQCVFLSLTSLLLRAEQLSGRLPYCYPCSPSNPSCLHVRGKTKPFNCPIHLQHLRYRSFWWG